MKRMSEGYSFSGVEGGIGFGRDVDDEWWRDVLCYRFTYFFTASVLGCYVFDTMARVALLLVVSFFYLVDRAALSYSPEKYKS